MGSSSIAAGFILRCWNTHLETALANTEWLGLSLFGCSQGIPIDFLRNGAGLTLLGGSRAHDGSGYPTGPEARGTEE